MAATSILKSWDEVPALSLKRVLFQTPNTADATNTLEITLADYEMHFTQWAFNSNLFKIKSNRFL